MTKLQNPVVAFLDQHQYFKKVAKARQRFSWKPFPVRFKAIHRLTEGSRLTLPLLSVATGVFFLGALMGTLMPWWLAFLFATVLLALWELGKALLITTAFELYYGGVRPGLALIALALGLSAGSVFVSVHGAQELHARIDHRYQQLTQQLAHEVQELQRFHDNRIQHLEDELRDYKKSVSWRGQINMANTTNQKVIANYNQRIADEVQALTKQTTAHEQQREQIKEKVVFHRYTFASLALLIDLLILLSGWFLVYYDYRTLEETHSLQQHERFSLDMAEIQEILGAKTLATHATTSPEPVSLFQRTIGFELKKKHEEARTTHEHASLSNTTYQDRYTSLIADIKAGVRDYRSLCKRHSVNVLTVKKFMEKYA